MTTIAYDGESIAADSRMVQGESLIVPRGVEKIRLIRAEGSRYVAAISGLPGLGMELVQHHIAGRTLGGMSRLFCPTTRSEGDTASAIVAHLDAQGGVRVYSVDAAGLATEITKGAFAIGSGREYALGAMASGASASDAVEVASKFDVFTGGPVRSVSLESDPETLGKFIALEFAP